MDASISAVGIIMDGNRRWAKSRNLSTFEGHRAGLTKAREVLDWAHDAGIREVTLYAFSTENWNREEKEITSLLGLFDFAFEHWFTEIKEKGFKVRFIGEQDKFSTTLQQKMNTLEDETRDGTLGTLVIALSYGGRADILQAARALQTQHIDVTETSFKNALWGGGLLDPELIIRTGGEKRLSNFLTWQSVYSELFFIDTLWPDFSIQEFDQILTEFSSREKRQGR